MKYDHPRKPPYGIVICGSWEAVANWIPRLRKLGCNYFVPYLDKHGPAIQFGFASWAAQNGPDYVYVDHGTPVTYMHLRTR